MKKIITPSVVSRCGLGTPLITIHRRGVVFNKSATTLLALHQGSRYVFELEKEELYYADRGPNDQDCFQVNTIRKTKVAETNNKGLLPFLFEKHESVMLEVLEFNEGRRLLRVINDYIALKEQQNGFARPVKKMGRPAKAKQ